ncbi:MAG: DDE transposase family protein [Nostocaceae cyanobacterium]|nr:DDE transposase family protein [Nostocaceae cyanobacterium]
MTNTQTWYIVKRPAGHCEIVPSAQLEDNGDNQLEIVEKWGPLTSKEDAIARRVGLIRAGKCQPQ